MIGPLDKCSNNNTCSLQVAEYSVMLLLAIKGKGLKSSALLISEPFCIQFYIDKNINVSSRYLLLNTLVI